MLVASRHSSDRRVHVDGDRPIGVGLVQRDTHQTVATLLHALLRDRRTQHVAQQRLPARRVESARRVAACKVNPSSDAHSGLS